MIDITTALYLLAAAAIAAIIRLYDTPATDVVVDGVIQWAKVVPIVVGAVIAAPVGAWILGLDVLVPTGFVAIVAVAVTGMAGVKALLGLIVKEQPLP